MGDVVAIRPSRAWRLEPFRLGKHLDAAAVSWLAQTDATAASPCRTRRRKPQGLCGRVVEDIMGTRAVRG